MSTRKKNDGKKPKDVINFKVNIAISVIIEKEDDLYTAHCLEFDIVADGKTNKEALENLFISIANHFDFCLSMGNPDKIMNPAPKEYWNKLNTIKKKSLYKQIKYPKSIPHKAEKLPFLKDIKFEGSEVYADA